MEEKGDETILTSPTIIEFFTKPYVWFLIGIVVGVLIIFIVVQNGISCTATCPQTPTALMLPALGTP